jgi:hypothetical protein
LQENNRGRFLKVSETFTRGYNRFQILIPAEGMQEFVTQVQKLTQMRSAIASTMEKSARVSIGKN